LAPSALSRAIHSLSVRLSSRGLRARVSKPE
jgi:hypothetical protein